MANRIVPASVFTTKRDADRNADQARDEKRRQPRPVQRAAHLEDEARLDDQPARHHQHGGMQRRDRVQPDRGRHDAVGEAGRAGRHAAEETAEPDDGQGFQRQSRRERGIGEHPRFWTSRKVISTAQIRSVILRCARRSAGLEGWTAKLLQRRAVDPSRLAPLAPQDDGERGHAEMTNEFRKSHQRRTAGPLRRNAASR